MIDAGVLRKMRAALFVCTCVAGCARGKHGSDAADANGVNANDSGKQGGSAIDAASPNDIADATTRVLDDDDDEPHDASIDAPYGVVACPIHGAHRKLPDGGVDLTGLLTPAPTPSGTNSTPTLGTIGIGGQRFECLGCGMGGPIPGTYAKPPTGSVVLGAVTSTTNEALARAVIATNLPRMRSCYRKALQNDPQVSGRVIITLRFDKNGAVIGTPNFQTTGDLPSTVTACISGSLRYATAPPALANATIVATVTMVHE